MALGGRREGAGRPPGVPNKVTRDVREAIAKFAQDNVEQMSVWLNQIEDPAKRMDLYLRAIEYHVPKLARSEVSGPDGAPIQMDVSNLRGLSTGELETMRSLMEKAAAANK